LVIPVPVGRANPPEHRVHPVGDQDQPARGPGEAGRGAGGLGRRGGPEPDRSALGRRRRNARRLRTRVSHARSASSEVGLESMTGGKPGASLGGIPYLNFPSHRHVDGAVKGALNSRFQARGRPSTPSRPTSCTLVCTAPRIASPAPGPGWNSNNQWVPPRAGVRERGPLGRARVSDGRWMTIDGPDRLHAWTPDLDHWGQPVGRPHVKINAIGRIVAESHVN